jgi:hypothetical protein
LATVPGFGGHRHAILSSGAYNVEFVEPFYWTAEALPLERGLSALAADRLPPADENPAPAAPADDASSDDGPRVARYTNSGCLTDQSGEPWMCTEDDLIEFVVEDATLYVRHSYANYNCCLDDIAVYMDIEDGRLLLTEQELAEEPCWCICCYEVNATIVGLSAGAYTVEFYWYDYDTSTVRCVVGEIVIH